MPAGFSWNTPEVPRPENDNCRVPTPDRIDLKNEDVINGVKGLPDLWAGPKKKNYLDFIAMRQTKLRGTTGLYWIMKDHHERNASDVSPFEQPDFLEDDDFFVIDEDFKVHGNVNFYGEPVEIGELFDTVKREVNEDWQLTCEPLLVRGVVSEIEEDEEPSEHGTILIRRLRYDIPRKMCEELKFRPWYHDVIRLTLKTASGVDLDGYYDVLKPERTESRFGSTGFFNYYTLRLVRSTRFVPERMGICEPPPYDVPLLRGNSGEKVFEAELDC